MKLFLCQSCIESGVEVFQEVILQTQDEDNWVSIIEQELGRPVSIHPCYHNTDAPTSFGEHVMGRMLADSLLFLPFGVGCQAHILFGVLQPSVLSGFFVSFFCCFNTFISQLNVF